MGKAAEIYDRVWAHMETRDWDRFMALFSDDVEMVFQDARFTGLEPTRAYFENVMRMFPDIRHRISSVIEAGDEKSMAGWVTAEAVATAPRNLFGSVVDVTGDTLAFEAVDFLFLNDEGKIKGWWAMLDLVGHMRSMNIEVNVRKKA